MRKKVKRFIQIKFNAMTLNPERINPFSNKEKSEKEYKFSYDDRDFVPAEAVLKSESRDWPKGIEIIHRSDKSQ